MRITVTPHRLPAATHSISDADAAAILRWSASGEPIPDTPEWGDLSHESRKDAEIAVAWRLHDVRRWSISD